MQFTTAIELPECLAGITHRSKIMLAGSCFAANIGNRMAERKFNIDINPFGILYNPLSINEMIDFVATGETCTAASPWIFEHNGMWHSIMHHSDFSRSTKEELLSCINSRLLAAHEKLSACDFAVFTYGTSYAYFRNCDSTVAGNCHKLPGSMFTRRMLGIEEIVSSTAGTINRLLAVNPGMKIILTVSPIRHLRDGAHDNQKSKATLLLAIDEITRIFNGAVFYFPAYEIMLDELRDYRFYAADMIHPSEVAIDYIWECWSRCCFSESTRRLNKEIEEINKALAHRPFSPQAESYKVFIKKTLERIETLSRQNPFLDFEKEITQCNTLLNR